MNVLSVLVLAAEPIAPSDGVVPWDLGTWGFGQWISALAAAGALVTLYLTFRRDKSAEISGNQNVKMQLDKLIDERVERNLRAAYDQIDAQNEKIEKQDVRIEQQGRKIEQIEGRLSAKTEENRRIRAAVKRVFSALFDWDHGGRLGEMPMPDQDDMDLLEIEPNPDTLQPGQVDGVRGSEGA